MTTGSERPGTGLGERLRELDTAETPASDALMEQMFADVKSRCEKSDRTLGGFLRSRSTMVRRLFVLSIFAGLGVAGWFLFPLISEEGRTMPWTASLAAFVILLLLAMFMVTRPVHLPALPRWQSVCLVCLAVGATVVAAFWPIPAAMAASTHDHRSGFMAGVCMGVGLLLGIPVYALLRLVDRGNALGNLVAAAAAGVAGNFVLKAHCPIAGTSHELLGHASVAVIFVAGLGLVHRWIPSK
jgi:phage shock protein PspC (stress-responsive transcriptional regulator)